MPTKTASKLALGALAAATPASGAIVVFDTNDRSANAGQYGASTTISGIDLNSGTFVNNPALPSITLYAGIFYNAFVFYGNAIGILRTPSNNLALLDSGDFISGAGAGFGAASLPLDQVPLGTHYVGLRMNQDSEVYYGWLEFTRSSTSAIQINQLAFNNIAGESILAGQTTAVPEASTLGFAGGLFGLVVAAHLRRRQQKQAAASEKLLSLAAGEKLN